MDPMPAELRRDRMLSMVSERDFMRVTDLSDVFGISAVTVRADLAFLADRGLLRRVHGGAMPRTDARVEPSFEEALDEFAAEKADIGRHAAGQIRSGDTVILDVGTTTNALAHALAARDDVTGVTVFTPSLTIALGLEPAIPRIGVILTGGTLRPRQHSLVDPMAGHVLSNIHAATAFIGCNGVHPGDGVTNINLPEAAVKQKIIAAAHRAVIVADGSKLGNVSVAKIADLGSFAQLITGSSAAPHAVDELRSRGLDVEIAQPGPRA